MHSQLDLFVTFVGDVPLRDERESMSLPMVSLSKRKRNRPIEWTSSDGKRWCHISANPLYGMATIYDLDVIIWAVSQINEAIEKGLKHAPTLQVEPYTLLKAIGREVGGAHYKRLFAALDRLQATTVKTSIRGEGKRQEATFSWLESWTQTVDEHTGKVRGMTITLPQWIYKAVAEERAVLAVAPEYFQITSGYSRWLYRLARRHAGKQVGGFRFLLRHLHERSGSTQPYNQFARDLRRVITRNDLPEYHIELIKGQKGDEVLSMVRDPGRIGMPQRRDLRRFGG